MQLENYVLLQQTAQIILGNWYFNNNFLFLNFEFLSCFIKKETDDYVVYTVVPKTLFIRDFYNIFGKYVFCYECIFYKKPDINDCFIKNLDSLFLLFSSLNLTDISLCSWSDNSEFYIYITLRELICELYFDYLNSVQEVPSLDNKQVLDAYSYICFELEHNYYYRIRFYLILCRYFFLTLI
jgi:hypothetical protein